MLFTFLLLIYLRLSKLANDERNEYLLFPKGDQHKHQRKAINPSFAHKHIKTMVPTFFRLAARLSEKWRQQLKPDGEATEFPEVMEDLSKTTLDIIGLAGKYFYNMSCVEVIKRRVILI